MMKAYYEANLVEYQKGIDAIKAEYDQFNDQWAHAYCRKVVSTFNSKHNKYWLSGATIFFNDLKDNLELLLVQPCKTEQAKLKAIQWIEIFIKGMQE